MVGEHTRDVFGLTDKKGVKAMLTHQHATTSWVKVLARALCGGNTHRPPCLMKLETGAPHGPTPRYMFQNFHTQHW